MDQQIISYVLEQVSGVSIAFVLLYFLFKKFDALIDELKAMRQDTATLISKTDDQLDAIHQLQLIIAQGGINYDPQWNRSVEPQSSNVEQTAG